VPQLAVRLPQPSSTGPQLAVPQPCAVQAAAGLPQRNATPPPPHVVPVAHVPQLMVPPQPLLTLPQLYPAGQLVTDGTQPDGALVPVIEVMVRPPLVGS
jgi:hypothetical protein